MLAAGDWASGISAADWAALFGLLLALAQNIRLHRRHRTHRREVETWTEETADQFEKLLRALRLCRQAEHRCIRQVRALEVRIATLEAFHGEGKCIPAPGFSPPAGDWPNDLGRWG